jgi:HK97 family phage portal protein
MAFWNKWFKEKRTTTGMVISSKGTAYWPDRDYHNFATEAYLKNVVAFRCIDEISKACASVPWKVYKKDSKGKNTEVDDHPYIRLFDQTNPSEGVSAFVLKMIAFLVLDGNSYVERIGPLTGEDAGQAREMYVIRPDRIKLIKDPDTQALLGYELNENGVAKKTWMLDPITMQADLLHLKLFHPTNDYMGAAPTEPASRDIDTRNEATEWNKKLLENEARPGMIFKFKTSLGDVQYERFKKSLEEGYSGFENAGKNLVLEGDGDATPYGYNPAELDFIEGGRELGRNIAMGYGVPPMIIGIKGDSTYNNMEQAELSFWEKTVMFYLRYVRAEFNNWLFDEEDDTFVDYDVDEIPALEPRRKEKYELAQKSDFLTINEKRELTGHEAHPDGDVILIAATQIPLGEEPPAEEEMDDELGAVEDELEDEGFDRDDVGVHLKAIGN